MDKKFLTFPKLSNFLEKCKLLFAGKEIEDKIINIQVSKEQPIGQKVGDVWFEEIERE